MSMVNVYALKPGSQSPPSSEAFVRHIAIRYAQMPEAHITFNRTAEGKPFMEHLPGFHFNISHSGKWLVCATHTAPVGIDIEQVAPLDILQYREHLSVAEYYALRALPTTEQLHHFYRLWTLKESYLKQTGMGLSTPMNSFTIQPHKGTFALLSANGHIQDGIYWKQYEIEEGYIMTVCATGNAFSELKVISDLW